MNPKILVLVEIGEQFHLKRITLEIFDCSSTVRCLKTPGLRLSDWNQPPGALNTGEVTYIPGTAVSLPISFE